MKSLFLLSAFAGSIFFNGNKKVIILTHAVRIIRINQIIKKTCEYDKS